MIELIERFIDPIKKRIFLLIGRAVLEAVNNTKKTQTVQVRLLNGEIATDIERIQEYGFESYPISGTAEAVMLAINGNRDQGLIVVVHDREYRPTNLESGDTAHYDYRGNMILCHASGISIGAANGVTKEKSVLGETLQTQLNTDRSAMVALQSAINAWNPVPNDGGAALKVQLATFAGLSMANYSSILSEKVKNN